MIVSKWCTNDNQPNLETSIAVSKLLGVKVQYLLAEEYQYQSNYFVW